MASTNTFTGGKCISAIRCTIRTVRNYVNVVESKREHIVQLVLAAKINCVYNFSQVTYTRVYPPIE